MKRGRIYTAHYGENIDVTQNFVTSITPFLNDSLELVIVNNSTNIDLEKLKEKYISVINTEKNLGYFGGIKFGMDQYTTNDIDYIVICNNDIEIKSSDFFKIVDEKLNLYDIIAPSTKTLNNIEQNPHRQKKPSIFRKILYRIYFSDYLFGW